ncbi:MAG: phosphoglucosamine mutase [Lachnospiraceae bacterium]|nr:phosphoglucosamine mutase [Candidatus Equihabitans merdae]
MGKYFGTDGFRGEANVNLKASHAEKIGKSLGHYLAEQAKADQSTDRPRVVIGKDTRLSGDMFEAALVSGLTEMGTDVCLLGVTTTPSVAYCVREFSFSCGIMISASHNPYYDNGIKIISATGRKISADMEVMLEEGIDGAADNYPAALRDNIGRVKVFAEGRESYVNSLKAIPTVDMKGLKVALDCANGSASAFAGPLYESFGADVHVISAEPDGLNINRGCGSTHIEALCAYVKDNGMDMGFAYDGDADRCLAVDDKGRVVDGDLILYICGKYLRDQGALAKDTIVTTVMSNIGLYKACDACGLKTEQTKVGDKYVAECMDNNGYELGGEQSGHIIFGKYATTGDGLLTSLMMVQAALAQGKSLSQMADEVTIFPQCLINVRVVDKKTTLDNANVQEAIRKASEALGSEGRILVRESGTEPLIRVMAEAATQEKCVEMTESIVDVIKAEGLALS